MSDGLAQGSSSPLGATPSGNGVNFSVFSKHATAVQLLLFDGVNDTKAARVVRLDPSANRTYHYWHVFVPNVRPGQLYAYRVEGPFDPSRGMRFDPTKVLLDPTAEGSWFPRPTVATPRGAPATTRGPR
jgi:isoamylase